MTPLRGHCPLGLGRPPGDPGRGERRGVLHAKLSGLRAWGGPKARRGNPGTEAATSLGILTEGTGTAFGGLGLPPLSA